MSDDATKPPTRRRTRAKKPSVADQTLADLPVVVSQKTTRRQTLPTNANILGSFPYAFLPRRQYQAVDLSTINVSTLSPQQVVDLLSDADPDKPMPARHRMTKIRKRKTRSMRSLRR
jgi:hypothetical protein